MSEGCMKTLKCGHRCRLHNGNRVDFDTWWRAGWPFCLQVWADPKPNTKVSARTGPQDSAQVRSNTSDARPTGLWNRAAVCSHLRP